LTDVRLESFQPSVHHHGIDLTRSQIKNALGMYVADVTAIFRAGMLVQLNSEQKIIICDGTIPFGFSKYNKTNITYAAIYNEYLQLNGVISTNLLHPSLLNPSLGGGVRVGIASTGTAYTEGSDYTVNYVNGQITRTPASTITSGGRVYVNYQYQMTNLELEQEGLNYWNQVNDVSVRNNRVSVVNDWSLIFTTAYDPSQTYQVNDSLVAGNAADGLSGLVTKGAKGTAFIGRVFQPPTSSDPYLGVRYVGGMIN